MECYRRLQKTWPLHPTLTLLLTGRGNLAPSPALGGGWNGGKTCFLAPLICVDLLPETLNRSLIPPKITFTLEFTMQPTKVTERIKTKALELLEQYPGGLRYSELHSKILATDSSFKPNTINGCIWNLDATFPEREMKKLLRHSRVGGNDGICVTNYVKINNPRKGKIMRSIVSLIAASAFVTTTSLALLLVPAGALAEEAHMGRAHNMMDRRISLGLSPEMRQHQLSNMRAHLAAIQKITGLLAEKNMTRLQK